MRVETLHAGVESEGLAFFPPRFLDQPIKKASPKTTGAIGGARHEIVEIKRPAGEEEVEESITGDRAHIALGFEVDEAKSFLLLPLHLPDELRPPRMLGPQFQHDRVTAADLGGAFRERNPSAFF